MEEEFGRERRRAEYMARAAAWQLEKEEAEEAKVVPCTCSLQITELIIIEPCPPSPAPDSRHQTHCCCTDHMNRGRVVDMSDMSMNKIVGAKHRDHGCSLYL